MHPPTSSIRSRLSKVRSRLQEQGLDAFLISSLPNIGYLTRFTGSNALCIVTPRRAFFLTDSRYTIQSNEEVAGFTRCIARGGLLEAAADRRLLDRCKTVGFESAAVTYAQFRNLKQLFPRSTWKPTTDLVEEIGLSKDAGEIALISSAVGITDRVFRGILPMLKPGATERDIASEISYLHRRCGAERDAFEPIVAAGARSALPHARPTGRKIRRGDLLVLDFGCVVGGYGSDLTRTVCIGTPGRKEREMYRVVLDAQRAAIEGVRAGMKASDLDSLARQRIAAAGYGRYFTHSLGHGLGLRIHERPRISALSTDILREGSVITIEPGVYIRGVGGVRIEDDVVVQADGCRVLTSSPKEFMVV